MNEIQRMRISLLANMDNIEIRQSMERAKRLLIKLKDISIYDSDYRNIIEELIPSIPVSSIIMPPFYCDHGTGIRLGNNVFINANCTFSDGAYITIGDYTLIGPNVQIYTPHHPKAYLQRRENKEYSYPVRIGCDCWIGGGSIICPGVTIGNKCIIGAGSVVTKDIPENCTVVGNPARIIQKNDNISRLM